MAVLLPKTIDAYFAASNAHSPEAMAQAFAADAVVQDEGGSFSGREAIAGWARAAIDKYQMRSMPLTVAEVGNTAVVRASVSGDFPGSPLQLTFRFVVAEAGIQSLEIGA